MLVQVWEFHNFKVAVEWCYMIAVAATTNVPKNLVLKTAEFCQVGSKSLSLDNNIEID